MGERIGAPRTQGHLAMLAFSLIVAGSFSLGKRIAGEIDPVALTAVRFLLAGALLGAGLAQTGRLRREHYRAPWRFGVLGGGYALYFVMMFEALKTATPVSTAAVFTLMPFFAAILERAISGRRNTGLTWVALGIGALGAIWVVFRGSLPAMLGFELGRGEFLFVIGTLGHASYAAMVPKLRRGEPAYALTLGVALAGAVILMGGFFPRVAATDWTGLRPAVWAVLAYLTVLASLGTFTLVNIAAMRLPAAKVTAYTYLIPFWVVLMEVAWGEALPAGIVLLGGVPIFFALAILFFGRDGGGT